MTQISRRGFIGAVAASLGMLACGSESPAVRTLYRRKVSWYCKDGQTFRIDCEWPIEWGDVRKGDELVCYEDGVRTTFRAASDPFSCNGHWAVVSESLKEVV